MIKFKLSSENWNLEQPVSTSMSLAAYLITSDEIDCDISEYEFLTLYKICYMTQQT